VYFGITGVTVIAATSFLFLGGIWLVVYFCRHSFFFSPFLSVALLLCDAAHTLFSFLFHHITLHHISIIINTTPVFTMSSHSNEAKEAPPADVQFNVEVDAEAELEEMKRQVDSLQEDMQLKTLQESAARDEGTRKTAAVAAAAQAGAAKTNTSIFVNDLDTRTTEADLRVFFAACGTISRVTVLKDRQGNPKGMAYVEFESEEQAHTALLKDGQSLHGKPLKVAMKRDNIPGFMRGVPRGGGGYIPRGGRGGIGGANPMQQEMATLAMLAGMMSQGFNPYSMGRGGGGRGRGRGRGGY
jgi:polyadenylate-binding protein 2